ncbi:MAG: HlyD family efflux transporter periplasmic adaptor subunit [Bacteroidetes bacterium]|nr:HlyD family efflux transporter periplasmic adaptor subunit [Bacteroidota bacterium]
MNKTNITYLLTVLILFFSSCTSNNHHFDASGSFEAIETIISSQASGQILSFTVEEGQQLTAGTQVGLIDTFLLHLKKQQINAQINAIVSRSPNINAQTAFFDQQLALMQTQLSNLQTEKDRLQKLVAGNAAPQKQLDDITYKIAEVEKQTTVIQQQKAAQVSALNTAKTSINSEPMPLMSQLDQLNDQIEKCQIINPVLGTVLTKYAEPNEITGPGKPLYKIADLSILHLKAYVSGDQLPKIRLNQKVNVLTDNGDGGYKTIEGEIIWINDKAEFTPKTIQTKNERANLVYAIKVKVVNDGSYKIGMYGEVNF